MFLNLHFHEKFQGTVGWYTCSQILKLKSQLRSLEILEATHNYLSKIHRYTQNVTGEVLPMGSLTEVREDDILLTPENCQNKKYLDLLDSAGIPVEGMFSYKLADCCVYT